MVDSAVVAEAKMAEVLAIPLAIAGARQQIDL